MPRSDFGMGFTEISKILPPTVVDVLMPESGWKRSNFICFMSTEEDEWTFGISPFYPTINYNGSKHYS